MRIKGKIFDKITGEPIPFANVFFSNRNGSIGYSKQGTITNDFGNYILEWPADLWITASAVGYDKLTLPLPEDYQGIQVLDFDLQPGINLTSVDIVAKPIRKKISYWYFVGLLTFVLALWYFSVKR